MANSYLAEGKTMTDEQKGELLDFIDETLMPFFQMDAADCPECRRETTMLQALRRLVEKFAEWQTLISKLAEARELMWTEREILNFNPFEEGEK